MSVMLNNNPRVRISDRLERLPHAPYLILLGGLVLMANFIENIDMHGLGYLLPVLSQYWHMDPKITGYLGSTNFIGMFFGAITCGYLADRFGRKPVLMAAMVIWGIAGLLFAMSWSVQAVFICRFIFGVGMGAQVPVATSMLSEMVPSRLRAKYIAFFIATLPLGIAASGLLNFLFFPYLGWRGMFVLEALFALWVVVLWKYLPESALWLEFKGRYSEADKSMTQLEKGIEKNIGRTLPAVEAKYSDNPDQEIDPETAKKYSTFRELFSRRYIKTTIMCTIWMSTTMMAYYGLGTWLTSLLVLKGFVVIKSIGYVSLINLGGIPAFFLISYLVEKIGRKWLIVIMAVLTAVTAYVYGQSTVYAMVIATGLLYMFCQHGLNQSNQAYLPELFETRLRGSGVGYTSACGRLGAASGSIIIGYLLASYGPSAVMVFALAINLLSAVTIAVLGHETKGKVF